MESEWCHHVKLDLTQEQFDATDLGTLRVDAGGNGKICQSGLPITRRKHLEHVRMQHDRTIGYPEWIVKDEILLFTLCMRRQLNVVTQSRQDHAPPMVR